MLCNNSPKLRIALRNKVQNDSIESQQNLKLHHIEIVHTISLVSIFQSESSLFEIGISPY